MEATLTQTQVTFSITWEFTSSCYFTEVGACWTMHFIWIPIRTLIEQSTVTWIFEQTFTPWTHKTIWFYGRRHCRRP